MSAPEPVISADSHICEIEACYADIDPKFRDSRPKAIFDEHAGAVLEVADLGIRLPMGLVCTGGRPPEDFARAVPWEELHPAGFDPKERLAIQDAEGVLAEVLYPSLGMMLCNHPDIDYQKGVLRRLQPLAGGLLRARPAAADRRGPGGRCAASTRASQSFAPSRRRASAV